MKTQNQSSQGFTLIELLVVIAIIAILASILFPVFSKARAKAREIACISNVKQIAAAIIIYRNENKVYPDIGWTTDSSMGLSPKVLICPARPTEASGYAINGYLHGLTDGAVINETRVISVFDATGETSGIEPNFNSHGGGAIIGFIDGHAKAYKTYDDLINTNAQFPAGLFSITKPLAAKEVFTGTATASIAPAAPVHYVRHLEGEDIKDEFLIAGPYGDGNQTVKTSTNVNTDFINEKVFFQARADESPVAGFDAPGQYNIFAPVIGGTLNFYPAGIGGAFSDVQNPGAAKTPNTQPDPIGAPLELAKPCIPITQTNYNNLLAATATSYDNYATTYYNNFNSVSIYPELPHVFQKWTPVDTTQPNGATGTGLDGLINPKNFNCKFAGKTTYAVTYMFTPVDIVGLRMAWWPDDRAVLWMDGVEFARWDDPANCQNVAVHNVDYATDVKYSAKFSTILKGVHMIVAKISNASQAQLSGTEPGGMKLNMQFTNLLGQPLYFSNRL
ncbi:MAG: prepilin-type N-terminal cleavage/methylation domain-containing protein [bacterium]